jgi:hypothetical protein
MVSGSCNSSTPKTQAGGLWVWGQPELHKENGYQDKQHRWAPTGLKMILKKIKLRKPFYDSLYFTLLWTKWFMGQLDPKLLIVYVCVCVSVLLRITHSLAHMVKCFYHWGLARHWGLIKTCFTQADLEPHFFQSLASKYLGLQEYQTSLAKGQWIFMNKPS